MAIKHTIRAKGNTTQEVELTPMKAIYHQCIECNGFEPVVDNVNWVKDCLSNLCPLYPFRLGDAHTGKIMSEENKAKKRQMMIDRYNKKKVGAMAG